MFHGIDEEDLKTFSDMCKKQWPDKKFHTELLILDEPLLEDPFVDLEDFVYDEVA